MWRIIPVLVCVIYLCAAAFFVGIVVGIFNPALAGGIIGWALCIALACAVLLAPVTVPFALSKSVATPTPPDESVKCRGCGTRYHPSWGGHCPDCTGAT